ncbi:MAG: helix-turn-helix transcriptional regulator [Phycisphaeraceae bacterium]|nr:helix-turn-helix transcriptional regulator [Phycisphaeraceae bacterium]
MQSIHLLTAREKEVLALIGQGCSTAQIALSLHRSQKTVQSHRLSIGRKLGVHNRVELARLAISAGLSPLFNSASADAPPSSILAGESAPAGELLRWIDGDTAGAVGPEFLRRLVRCAAKAMQASHAFIAELTLPDRRQYRLVAVWPEPSRNDEQDCLFPIAPGPCHSLLIQHSEFIPKGVRNRFPNDPLIQRLQADSFLGTVLLDAAKTPIGILAVAGEQEISSLHNWMSLINKFGPRAGHELERLLTERLLRRTAHKLVGPNGSPIQSLLDITSRIDEVVNRQEQIALSLEQVTQK